MDRIDCFVIPWLVGIGQPGEKNADFTFQGKETDFEREAEQAKSLANYHRGQEKEA
jgi:hypothetical protein